MANRKAEDYDDVGWNIWPSSYDRGNASWRLLYHAADGLTTGLICRSRLALRALQRVGYGRDKNL